MEIEKWAGKCNTPSKTPRRNETPSKSSSSKHSRNTAKSPVRSPFKRRHKGHEKESTAKREKEHLRSHSDGALAQGMKRKLDDEKDEHESPNKRARVEETAGETAEAEMADVPMSSISAPNLAETVIQIRSPRDSRSPAAFRNAPRRRPNIPTTSIPLSPNKKTASPKPVFAHKENAVNGSPGTNNASEPRSPLSPKSPKSPMSRTPTMRHSLGATGVNSPVRKLNFSVL